LTGGHCLYASQPREIAQSLKDKVAGLSQIFADQLRFEFQLPVGISLNYAFRLQPETALLETVNPIFLGRIPKKGNLSVLLEFVVVGLATYIENVVLAEGRLSLDLPGRQIPKTSLRLSFSRPSGEQGEKYLPPDDIVKALSHLTLYRMQERVQNDVASGNIKGATQHLQLLATSLLSRGETELAGLVLEEAKNLQVRMGLTEVGKKKIKYGTRALLSEISFKSLSESPVDS
jgi:Ca-activated chloride channel family protein